MKILNTKELMLAVFLLVGKIVGRTKLQKLFWLLEEEQQIPVGVDFDIYLYGPFSRDLNNKADELIDEGLMSSDEGHTKSGDVCYEYNLSEDGRKEATKIFDSLPKETRDKILKHISKFNSMTPSEIVKYVYEHYPNVKPGTVEFDL